MFCSGWTLATRLFAAIPLLLVRLASRRINDGVGHEYIHQEEENRNYKQTVANPTRWHEGLLMWHIWSSLSRCLGGLCLVCLQRDTDRFKPRSASYTLLGASPIPLDNEFCMSYRMARSYTMSHDTPHIPRNVPGELILSRRYAVLGAKTSIWRDV